MINNQIQTNSLTVLMVLMVFMVPLAHAHPTGNMIVVGEHVLWSYIHPVDDPNHYACVMIWKEGSEPKVFIQSDYAASDYMLFNNRNEIYVIERRFIQLTEDFQIRVLKTTIDGEPEVIWNWFKDELRIGEGGFFMISDDQIVFGMYPNVYTLRKGEKPMLYFEFDIPVKRLRAQKDNQILLLGDEKCFLVLQDGTILKHWDKLIDHGIKDAPLNRNQIFDADYNNGRLLLAYWGNRSFDIIDESGKRKTILQHNEPLTPHWVGVSENELFLFSSELIFDGSMPRPHLIKCNNENEVLIWER